MYFCGLIKIKDLTNPLAGNINKKLYPHQKKEVKDKIKDLLKEKGKDADKEQQAAINLLNVFRYLCGVSPTVVYDKKYAQQAEDAAKACRKHGGLSHDLGHSTHLCNLHQGQPSMQASVRGYMDDSGDNNREKRGHRMWCLSPTLGKCGFGADEGFQAMRVMDGSAKKPVKTAYSYPGRGFYPQEYLLGTGWSYYAPNGTSLGDDVTVEMWRLSGSLKEKPKKDVLTDSRAVPIIKVFPNGNYVVFEPDRSKMKSKGTYWIRIKAGNFKDEYVVDLF